MLCKTKMKYIIFLRFTASKTHFRNDTPQQWAPYIETRIMHQCVFINQKQLMYLKFNYKE